MPSVSEMFLFSFFFYLRHPQPFRYTIRARSVEARELVRLGADEVV